MCGNRKVVMIKVEMFVRILYSLGIPIIGGGGGGEESTALLLFLDYFVLYKNTVLGDLHEFSSLSSS